MISTNLVGVHPRNIHTKFEANPCSVSRAEVEKKVHDDDNNDDRHSLIASVINNRNSYVYIWYLVASWACEVIVIFTQKKLPQCTSLTSNQYI